LEIASLVYTLNCKLDGNAYCLDAHYLAKKKDNQTLCEKQKGNQTFRGNQNKVGIKGVCQ
jgi:hypothetical protein